MIRVLVAEDELPLLRGISNMIEDLDSDFSVVMRAKNGKEAVRFLNQERVDIVFTDINMPMMDGLALLKYIAENNPEIATVVISGYDEFAYVQSAIRCHAKNYLLKPLNRAELKNQLAELKKEIKQHSYRKQEEFLIRLLFGNEMPVPAQFEGNLFPLCLCAGACISRNVPEDPGINEFWGEVPIRTLLYEIRDNTEGIFCYMGRNFNEMIILLEEKNGTEIPQIASQLLLRLPDELPITIVYAKESPSPQELKRLIYSFFDRIREEGSYGKSSILEQKQKKEEYWPALAQLNALVFAVGKGNKEEIKKYFNNFQAVLNHICISQKDLEHFIKKLIPYLCPSQEGKEWIDSICADSLELICESNTLEQFFEDFYCLWEDSCYGETVENGKELMQEVDVYIQEHIKEPITTKELSHKFGLVSPYLSKLFKEYKGESPTQYLQSLRIQNAKEMLLQYPDMLAKDVAEMIGYSNPLYFSKIFKKKVGVYPSEFRTNDDN